MINNSILEPTEIDAVPRSVCVVTEELLGRGRESEVAGSMAAIAQRFAEAGENVTLLWVPGQDQVNQEEITELVDYYYLNYLINLEVLQITKEVLTILWTPEQKSAGLYYYLKSQKYDIVYIPLEGGISYYTLIAKEENLFKDRPNLVLVCHSPIEWHAESNKYFLEDLRQVTIAHMERYCVSMPDLLISTSKALYQWMQQKNWELAENVKVLLALSPYEWTIDNNIDDDTEINKYSEIILLADHQYMSGITLFCDAVDKLNKIENSIEKITVFGPFNKILGEHTSGMLLRRGRLWSQNLQIIPRSSLREQLKYTRNNTALAIIPALANATGHLVSACIDADIRFLATRSGSNHEICENAGNVGSLCKTDAADFAQNIVHIIRSTDKTNSKYKTEDRINSWLRTFDELDRNIGKDDTGTYKDAEDPFVSVIMVHHDRPDYLLQAVDAVKNQTYDNLELILVDDGSRLPESKLVLDRLESDFENRGWKILRRENKYLGAARNAGVKESKGERILFVDDDNALFPYAVEKFVSAMSASGADVCTAFQRVFYERYVPESESLGHIHYYPPGGSLDLGFLHDSFGDANAMIRRSVFDSIGYQIEDYGYTAQDWEFFTRTVLAGLKLRVIPEPLYWYRSDTKGMYRTSHWYDNRLPIIKAFKQQKFQGLDLLYHLALSKFVIESELEGFKENLLYSPSDHIHHKLAKLEPNSDEAINLLAEIAAYEGRPDTALILLGKTHQSDFVSSVLTTFTSHENALQNQINLNTVFYDTTPVTMQQLRLFQICSRQKYQADCLFYVEEPDFLHIQCRTKQPTVAALSTTLPDGIISASVKAELQDQESDPIEIMLMLTPTYKDAENSVNSAQQEPSEWSSGWCSLSQFGTSREITAGSKQPSESQMNIVLAVKLTESAKNVNGTAVFRNLTIQHAMGADSITRPRIGPPPQRLPARELNNDDFEQAVLVSNIRSELPLLMVDRKNGGIFLRPHASGPVAGKIPFGFPAFARKVKAMVEIAHDEADDFEFALALSRIGEEIDWDVIDFHSPFTFSGWYRVSDRFKLHELELILPEKTKVQLSLNFAVRLPSGSKPSPANAFFRQFIISWDE